MIIKRGFVKSQFGVRVQTDREGLTKDGWRMETSTHRVESTLFHSLTAYKWAHQLPVYRLRCMTWFFYSWFDLGQAHFCVKPISSEGLAHISINDSTPLSLFSFFFSHRAHNQCSYVQSQGQGKKTKKSSESLKKTRFKMDNGLEINTRKMYLRSNNKQSCTDQKNK